MMSRYNILMDITTVITTYERNGDIISKYHQNPESERERRKGGGGRGIDRYANIHEDLETWHIKTVTRQNTASAL